MQQYSAKLLFQYRRRRGKTDLKRVLCEERIVTFSAASPKTALAQAKRVGRGSEHDYSTSDGGHVFFEFLGVADLIDISLVSDEGEVWYEFSERVSPKKRLRKLIPNESQLTAFRKDPKPFRVKLQ